MLDKWTGDVVGKMHIHQISGMQLAQELGVTNRWVSAVLNGHRTAKNAETRFRDALEAIIKRKGED